jgi:transcriptional regulator with XRE-family HTH domain
MIDLKKTLKEAGMTQEEFAEIFGKKKQNVNYWIKNRIPIQWYFKIKSALAERDIKIYHVKE